jgi:hypothetical protein
VTTPAIEAEARTATEMADLVNAAELRLAVMREIQSQAGLDAPNPYAYHEILWGLSTYRVPDGDDDDKRDFALAWLRRHRAGMVEVANRLGQHVTFDKFATDFGFGIKTTIHHRLHESVKITLRAQVDPSLTCTYVETGETETIPARPAEPEKVVPKMERVCPPSIFAGVEELV